MNLATIIKPAFPPTGHITFQTTYYALHITHTLLQLRMRKRHAEEMFRHDDLRY
jgi:hypothetical protein